MNSSRQPSQCFASSSLISPSPPLLHYLTVLPSTELNLTNRVPFPRYQPCLLLYPNERSVTPPCPRHHRWDQLLPIAYNRPATPYPSKPRQSSHFFPQWSSLPPIHIHLSLGTLIQRWVDTSHNYRLEPVCRDDIVANVRPLAFPCTCTSIYIMYSDLLLT